MDAEKLVEWARKEMEQTADESKKDIWLKGYRSALHEVIEKIERGDFEIRLISDDDGYVNCPNCGRIKLEQ